MNTAKLDDEALARLIRELEARRVLTDKQAGLLRSARREYDKRARVNSAIADAPDDWTAAILTRLRPTGSAPRDPCPVWVLDYLHVLPIGARAGRLPPKMPPHHPPSWRARCDQARKAGRPPPLRPDVPNFMDCVELANELAMDPPDEPPPLRTQEHYRAATLYLLGVAPFPAHLLDQPEPD